MMKNIICAIGLLFTFTFVQAQNSTEAKLAYQMAEEQFDAKQYTKALDYLKKAETALGSSNPPIAYLKVMIMNQIFDVSFGKADWKKALENLEKELVNFEQTKNKEALADEKLMEVYRIKQGIEERRQKYERFWANESIKIDAFNTFFNTFPKVGIDIKDFFRHPYAKLWRGYESFKTIVESYRKGDGKQLDGTTLDEALRIGEPFVYRIKTNAKGIVTEYLLITEFTAPTVTKDDFMSAIRMPAMYADAFQPVKGNFLYNENLKGYQLKQNNPPYILTIDTKLQKSDAKYRRNGRKKYIDFVDVYVKFDEQ
ncbi:hypothetical protein [Sphingobacterium yanglingense]|uniref:Tetratricopeptide repeat protein n=1 Tax=Sphingobacterium yanglingense TaxID=1437280 RepID=A0A4R6WB59_9SPHI|nr:hypothetical protein [Sphingobacterium yanglingense]TDQ76608.1 hypothetical protein CLV99_3201 [Sphingobacterium yanglingense]